MAGLAPTIKDLVGAAQRVAAAPSDENISALLRAAFAVRFDEMPREFLDSPVFPRVSNSLGRRIFGDTSDQARA